ncbi:MAG TPA: aminoglycoside phosphotransferase family protein [Acidimicrobiia bacterium]|nr:aminoglycoside phosphotransferase family protein [Acidimicrobiia bacterium]
MSSGWLVTEGEGVAYRCVEAPNGARILWPAGNSSHTAFKAFAQLSPRRRVRWRPTENETSIDPELIDSLRSQLSGSLPGSSFDATSFFVAELTPYQKVTAAIPNSQGESLAYVKMSLAEQAQDRVEHEIETLSLLAERDLQLAPRLLDVYQAPGGPAPVAGALPGRFGRKGLDAHHADWVAQLNQLAADREQVEARIATMHSRISLVHENFTDPEGTYERGLNLVGNRLVDAPLPFTLAHGDFAPWNIRSTREGGLTALDWEGSLAVGPPLFDLFYHQMVTSRSRWRLRRPWDRSLKAFSSAHWPQLDPWYESLRTAFLVFAIDEYADVTKLDPSPGPTWRWLTGRLAETAAS